jgi:hypothetical protein
MELEKRRDNGLDADSSFEWGNAIMGIESHVIEEKHDAEKAKEPKSNRSAGTVCDATADTFGIPNLASSSGVDSLVCIGSP